MTRNNRSLGEYSDANSESELPEVGTEFHVTGPIDTIAQGLYIQVEETYELNNERYVACSSNGMGPEVEFRAAKFNSLVNSGSLKRDHCDTITRDAVSPGSLHD